MRGGGDLAISNYWGGLVTVNVYGGYGPAPKRLRCFVVGCNNEHSSSHLLPSSKRLERITFGSEGKAPSIYLKLVESGHYMTPFKLKLFHFFYVLLLFYQLFLFLFSFNLFVFQF